MDVKNKRIKEFVFNGMLVEDSLSNLEQQGIKVIDDTNIKITQRVLENDFSPRLWYNASKMSSVYVALYCAENMLRDFIVDRLSETKGIDWWEKCVPKKVRDEVQKLKDKEEKNKYYSNRSNSNIGYTMLGNLTNIIIYNWDDFSDIIPSPSLDNFKNG